MFLNTARKFVREGRVALRIVGKLWIALADLATSRAASLRPAEEGAASSTTLQRLLAKEGAVSSSPRETH